MTTPKSFLLDLNRCTGCGACTLACAIENQLPWGENWRWIETYNERHISQLPFYHFSLACNHCVDAPCVKSCPALAIGRDARTGAVLIDPDLCIGCTYCSWSCPYDAPRFSESLGVMRKCTFCNERQLEGLLPACVQQCPTGALNLMDLTENPAPVPPGDIPGFPQTAAKPSLRFVPLRQGHLQPEMALPFLPLTVPMLPRELRPKISLRCEWPLWIFTLLCAVVVGWVVGQVVAGFLDHPATPVRRLVPLPVAAAGWMMEGGAWIQRLIVHARAWTPWIFAVVCVIAMALSITHLSKKKRAIRSVLNLRHSWLSREIFFFLLFFAISFFYLLMARYGGVARNGIVPPLPWSRFVDIISILAAVTGMALVFSIDRVYSVLGRKDLWRHSAAAIMIAAVVFALTLDSIALVTVALLLQGVLYLLRKMDSRTPRAVILPGLRLLVTIVLPLVLWWQGGVALAWVAAIAVFVGAAIDRAEFYRELDPVTVQREIEQDLAARAAEGLRI